MLEAKKKPGNIKFGNCNDHDKIMSHKQGLAVGIMELELTKFDYPYQFQCELFWKTEPLRICPYKPPLLPT
jgi:hypothetical protein